MSRERVAMLAAGGLVAAVVLLVLVGPIPQDPAYHRFADTHAFLGIPNFGDVASNLPFLIVSVVGMWLVVRAKVLTARASGSLQAGGFPASARTSARFVPSFIDPDERRAWFLIFVGVALVAFGSAYYHWHPTTPRLVWDRYPMTVVFTTFTAIQVMERIGTRIGARLLLPFGLAGVASVFYWQATESWGRGDLRPYAVVQYLPFLGIPLLLALFPARYTRTWDFAGVFAGYAAAKVFELYDAPIFSLTGHAVSGHTLKHIAAAGATA